MSSGEFGHISQFYETLLLLVIFSILSFEILSFLFNFSFKERHLKQMVAQYIDHQQWINANSQAAQTVQQPNPQQQPQIDLEKSVAQQLQKEIANMEKPQQQPANTQPQSTQSPALPSTPIQIPQQEPELPKTNPVLFSIYVAFNNFISEKFAILVPLLIVGILTKSTYVYTLVAFFCSFLCDLIVQVLDAEQKAHNLKNTGNFGLKQGVNLLGNGFIMSIFITYWSVTQFNAS